MPIDPAMLSVGITAHHLCTRCGTCVGACPTGAITVGQNRFPELDAARCTQCGLCAVVCPGDKVNFLGLNQQTFGVDSIPENFDGHVIGRYVAYATDEKIRNGGAGGGVVTALLWDQLKHGDVEGCITTRMRPDKPWLGEHFIARSYEQLLESQGSRYTIIPLNAVFQDIRRSSGPYAYAALPCQVHGFRNLEANGEQVSEKISVTIGLFCGGALEPELITDLLRAKRIAAPEIADFKFRGGEWPGKMQAILKDGTSKDLHYSNYKDGAYNYFVGLYMPRRCQTCLDGSGLFSDVSVGDAWTRDASGNYAYPRHSRLLVRTEKGLDVVQRAAERGSLSIRDVTSDPNYATHRLQTKRKGVIAPIRVARLEARGERVPKYDLPTPETTFRERIVERAVSGILTMATLHFVRYSILRFVTSRYTVPLIGLRQWLKRRKYRRSRGR